MVVATMGLQINVRVSKGVGGGSGETDKRQKISSNKQILPTHKPKLIGNDVFDSVMRIKPVPANVEKLKHSLVGTLREVSMAESI
jgi:hypothetical protein